MVYNPIENNIDSIIHPRFYGDKHVPGITEVSADPLASLGKNFHSNSRTYIYGQASGTINCSRNPQSLSDLGQVSINLLTFQVAANTASNAYAIRPMTDGQYGLFVLQMGGSGGSGGTSNYNDLSNKPKINDTELQGSLYASTSPSADIIIESRWQDLQNRPDFIIGHESFCMYAFVLDQEYPTGTLGFFYTGTEDPRDPMAPVVQCMYVAVNRDSFKAQATTINSMPFKSCVTLRRTFSSGATLSNEIIVDTFVTKTASDGRPYQNVGITCGSCEKLEAATTRRWGWVMLDVTNGLYSNIIDATPPTTP